MKERVGALTGAAARVMWVMTFHSACARILRQHADRLGLQARLHDLRRGGLAADGQALHGRARDRPEAVPAALDQGVRSPAPRTGSATPRRCARSRARSSRRPSPTSTRSTSGGCTTANAMDFDDLLVRTVNLFELFADLRERYARNFRHVLVDEYQDTNRVQYRLLQLLSGEHGNLFVVGDESQSIYGFRAADIRNILDFERDFPEAATVKLEQNYRSTGTILDAANGAHRPQPRPARQEPLDRRRTRRAGDDRRARRRARGGAVGRRRDRPARRRARDRPRRGRGLLPDQRPEPGARGHARPLRRALPGDRRHEVLRAGRDPRRDRLPERARQPRRQRRARRGS